MHFEEMANENFADEVFGSLIYHLTQAQMTVSSDLMKCLSHLMDLQSEAKNLSDQIQLLISNPGMVANSSQESFLLNGNSYAGSSEQISDRVRAVVVGPSGDVVQEVDTKLK